MVELQGLLDGHGHGLSGVDKRLLGAAGVKQPRAPRLLSGLMHRGGRGVLGGGHGGVSGSRCGRARVRAGGCGRLRLRGGAGARVLRVARRAGGAAVRRGAGGAAGAAGRRRRVRRVRVARRRVALALRRVAWLAGARRRVRRGWWCGVGVRRVRVVVLVRGRGSRCERGGRVAGVVGGWAGRVADGAADPGSGRGHPGPGRRCGDPGPGGRCGDPGSGGRCGDPSSGPAGGAVTRLRPRRRGLRLRGGLPVVGCGGGAECGGVGVVVQPAVTDARRRAGAV